MESVVIDMCEDIVDEEELDLATRLQRDPSVQVSRVEHESWIHDPVVLISYSIWTTDSQQDSGRNLKTGKVEAVNGRNPRLKDMADVLADFFRNPLLCKDDYADLFLMYLGKFPRFSMDSCCPHIILISKLTLRRGY